MTQEEFETKWHGHIVVPRPDGYKIPTQNYIVTAALYHYFKDDESIFAIFGEGGFLTMHLSDEEVDTLNEKFEILED